VDNVATEMSPISLSFAFSLPPLGNCHRDGKLLDIGEEHFPPLIAFLLLFGRE
jgi:hypothetical protein